MSWALERKELDMGGDAGADASTPALSGVAVRDRLIQILADTLRDLPGEDRTLLYLPRLQVATDWSQWAHEMEPVGHGGRWRFGFTYMLSPSPREWDPAKVQTRIHELWQMWGWLCDDVDATGVAGHRVAGMSPEGFDLIVTAKERREHALVQIESPTFDKFDGDEWPVVMPFAVTPFGPLSLPAVWAFRPDLIQW